MHAHRSPDVLDDKPLGATTADLVRAATSSTSQQKDSTHDSSEGNITASTVQPDDARPAENPVDPDAQRSGEEDEDGNDANSDDETARIDAAMEAMAAAAIAAVEAGGSATEQGEGGHDKDAMDNDSPVEEFPTPTQGSGSARIGSKTRPFVADEDSDSDDGMQALCVNGYLRLRCLKLTTL